MCYPEAPFYLAVNYSHTIHGFWYKIQKNGHSKNRCNNGEKKDFLFLLEWKEDESFC